MIAQLVVNIYTRMNNLCFQNNETRLMQKISLAFAFNPTIQIKLYKYLSQELRFSYYLKGKLSPEDSNNFLNTLMLFLLALSNQLMITDAEDFFKETQIFGSKNDLKYFTQDLIQICENILINPSGLQDMKLKQKQILYTASVVLNQLNDFNQSQQYLPNDKWHFSDMYIQDIMQQMDSLYFYNLSVVQQFNFAFPFENRIHMLKRLIQHQKAQNNVGFKLMIRRNLIFEDGYTAFQEVSKINLKARLSVQYINEFGMEEEGIDAGGIFKEFINDLSKIVFNPNYGLFQLMEDSQQIYPHPNSLQIIGQEHLNYYYFIGGVIGRAIYDNILLQTQFSKFFIRKMMGKTNQFLELQYLDKELYKNLKFLRNYEGDPEDLCLNFVVKDCNNRDVELIRDGKNVPVTQENKFRYIYMVSSYKLNTQIKEQARFFVNGLQRVINRGYLQIFSEEELQMIISGSQQQELDIEDLKKNAKVEGFTVFENGYVKDFFNILQSYSVEQQHALIKFVTSCERPPLLGFSNLQPQFQIIKIDSENDSLLPKAATCFNRLYLPKYSSKRILQQKLLTAITHGQGFYME